MNIKPLQDCIIVKQATETQKGLIILPTEKLYQGEIMAVGDGKNGSAMETKVGDVVLFGQHAGEEFKHNGEKFLAMREADIIGILND